MKNQKGFASIIFILPLLLLSVLFVSQTKFSPPPSQTTTEQAVPYCRPDLASDGNPKADAPSIDAPSYTMQKIVEWPSQVPVGVPEPTPVLGQIKPYKLIKKDAPLIAFVYDDAKHGNRQNYLRDATGNELVNPVHCAQATVTADGRYHTHFCQYIHPAVTPIPSPNSADGSKQYAVLYPYSWSGNPGWGSAYYSGNNQQSPPLFFADYQLLFLLHLDANGSPIDNKGKNDKGQDAIFWTVDVYQQVRYDSRNPNPIANPQQLPSTVITCTDPPSTLGKFTIESVSSAQGGNSQLQLESFVPATFQVEWDWYYPACKPAIYLYPQEKTSVHVGLQPAGYITYSDPSYPLNGWDVIAFPNGDIVSNGKSYPYLYYESAIKDSSFTKPKEGYVVRYTELADLFSTILPTLGLDDKQMRDFKIYWEKVLPISSYYFVGVMKQPDIDRIDPLMISPSPNTVIRVRLYFEALDKQISVEVPQVEVPQRNGFTVVEWGGMVKTDKNHPFTCSQ